MTPPPISEHITFIYTRDLSRLDPFYRDVLNLPLALDQGGCRIYRVTDTAYIGVCERENAATVDPQERTLILTMVADDVDGWADHLESHGVTLEKRPAAAPEYGIYHLFFRDPDNHLLEIQRFESDSAWHTQPE